MVAGETILKFTDYPFAYSIVGIISGMIGFSLGQNSLIFLGLAGAIGTFLTIVDPLGEMLRKNAERRIKKKSKIEKLDDLELQFKFSSLKSKSITYEMEKIIGMFYFVIVIILFLIAVVVPTPFFDKLVILDNDKVPLCSEWCFKFSYLGLGLSALIIISEKGRRFWKELDNKVNIAANHMSMINDDNATQTSVESMTRAVEQNDWGLAKIWQEKIKEEIKYKKGKRELIIKAADTVFSPLHFEASEFQKYLQNRMGDPFKEFTPEQWIKIKQNSLQSIVEDVDLRQRIKGFYNTMNDYNSVVPHLFLEMNNVINKKFSEVFNKNIEGVEFYLDPPNSGNTVHLQTCALFEIHPLKFVRPPRQFNHFKLRIKIEQGQLQVLEHTELSDFDNAWKHVLEDVKNDEMMIKIKKYLKELEIENNKLMIIYSDKIEMQWKV